MSKAAFNRKYTLNATGILAIDGDIVFIENPDTGELVQLSELMADFANRTCKLILNYDEDYDTEVQNDT